MGRDSMIIKVLLVAAILAFGYVAVRGRPSARHLALRRGLASAVLVFGLVAVLVPQTVTWAANRVGVGRGTDLVLYVLAVSFLLVTATLMQRLTDLERKYVVLARRIAIGEAATDQEQASRPSNAPAAES
ncbi:MAG TPA: DUF2304 domain-containing protein [Longimicrobiaceae bacterium]|nr:DUF2304 domain-containing protein [Longimicrobiaceae bacterium]